jgi:inner membrane protein
MLGRSHLLLASAAYVALVIRPAPTPLSRLIAPLPIGPGLHSPAVALGVGMLLVAAGSLSPDIDRAGSSIARVAGLPTRAIAWVVERSFGHRGALHSALAVLLVLLLGEMIGHGVGVRHLGGLFAFGWASHILLDALTARGVPALWPLHFRLRLPPGFVTGGLQEHVVLVLGLVVCGVWVSGARPIDLPTILSMP